jgi:flagellar hook-associated protein 1 FlgK
MGLVGTALQIGKSALLTYQYALNVVGQNIANAGSEKYTRQTPVLSPLRGPFVATGVQTGMGVAITELQRNIDESLENRLRQGVADEGSALTQREGLARLEAVLNELSDTDLSTLLEDFFGAFSTLQNDPHDLAARSVAIGAGESLVTEIRRQRDDVLAMVDQFNENIKVVVGVADQLGAEIAALNQQITATETAGGGVAGALRDERDAKLRELSEIIEVEIRPQENGSVNVYIGNELYVQDGLHRSLTTETRIENGVEKVRPIFADDNGPLTIRSGKLEGLIDARDTHALGHLADLDSLSKALIQEVNKVHAQGRGLKGYTSLTGDFGVGDPTAALNSTAAGLDLTPKNGTFQIVMTNTTTGTSVATTIEVDLDGIGADTTLNSLVADINANVDNLTASVTADNKIKLVADNGFEMTFAEDSANVLAALGVNTFFKGESAFDIEVNSLIAADPELLAVAQSDLPGDGSNALAISKLGNANADALGGVSIIEFYNRVAGKIAVNASTSNAAHDAAQSILESLKAQRESISGVSLDEEAIRLVKYERSFQGAARFVSVVDELINEMLALVR